MKWRARMTSPLWVSTAVARPCSTTMRFGSDNRRISPPLRSHRGLQRPRQRCRAAAGHLRLGGARHERRNVMAEAAHAEVDLAQPVEEQEPGLDGRMLEFLLHELERRERAHGQQPASRRASLQELSPLVRRKRRRPALPRQDVAHDRHELVVPALQRVGIARAELAERRDGPRNVGPPFQRAAVAGQERDVELRLDVGRSVTRQREVLRTTACP